MDQIGDVEPQLSVDVEEDSNSSASDPESDEDAAQAFAPCADEERALPRREINPKNAEAALRLLAEAQDSDDPAFNAYVLRILLGIQPQRKRLEEYSEPRHAVQLLQKSKRILVLTGAGYRFSDATARPTAPTHPPTHPPTHSPTYAHAQRTLPRAMHRLARPHISFIDRASRHPLIALVLGACASTQDIDIVRHSRLP